MHKIRQSRAHVRHRIDGLEITSLKNTFQTAVRHRIDGLEISMPQSIGYFAVRHRIDGLETKESLCYRR